MKLGRREVCLQYVQLERYKSIFPVPEYKEAFDIFDANKDGKISTAELKQMMIQLGQEPTDDEVKSIMTTADTNGNYMMTTADTNGNYIMTTADTNGNYTMTTADTNDNHMMTTADTNSNHIMTTTDIHGNYIMTTADVII